MSIMWYHSSPSLQKIASGVGIGRTTVHRYLWEMNEKGMLCYDGKTIETKSIAKSDYSLNRAPVLGSVVCGSPELAEEDFEEFVALPVALFGQGDFFVLHTHGDSMIDAGIDEGDTEQGKYSAKYALSEVLICGCCGSHYRRTGKNVRGAVVHTWRCIGRIEHRCKDAVGAEENRLHTAICKCLSEMMSNREAVVSLCRTNLQYAITGDTKILDAYAIENQISLYQDEIDVLMEQEEKTGGDPERFEKAIIALYEKIGVLREQLRLAQKQADASETVSAETERFLKAIEEYGDEDFTEFNDIVVRRLIECIRVMPNRSIEVVLKGGMMGKIAY